MTTLKNVKPLDPIARDYNIDWKNVEDVYIGRLDCCGCGCEGDYLYTTHYANYRANTDGNKLLLDLVSNELDERIQEIIEEMSKSEDIGQYTSFDRERTFVLKTHEDDNGEYGYRLNVRFDPFVW